MTGSASGQWLSTQSVAVIDLGSASSRMLISSVSAGNIRKQTVTRMGEGLVSGGLIASASLQRVREVLLDYRRLCDETATDQIAVVATAAARQARNNSDLVSVVSDVFDVELQVLSEREEGRLAFAGATASLGSDSPHDGAADGTLALVLDIGGASTEFSVGTVGSGSAEPTEVVSIPVGAVTITEQYIESDPPDPAELSSALSVVSSHVDDVIRLMPGVVAAAESGLVIGVGGTISTCAAVEIGLIDYHFDAINGFRLEREAVEDVFRTLATEDHADRAFNPGLAADRVPLVVGGLCILVAVMRRLGIGEIIVSEEDLLEGLVAELRQQ